MRTLVAAASLLLGLPLVVPGAAVVHAAEPDMLIAEQHPSRLVVARDVTTRRGVVSGVLENHSRKRLRDVRLLFHHTWYWKDERHPGDDSPGRVDYYTLRTELPPGEEVEFSYRPEPPLPDRDDGRFGTTVEVVGWTEIGR